MTNAKQMLMIAMGLYVRTMESVKMESTLSLVTVEMDILERYVTHILLIA